MKRLVIYLLVTFVLTWGLLIPAGFALGTFENGESSSTLIVVLIAVSMFFPLVGALVANVACKPEERIYLGWRSLISGNVRPYLIAWFAPAVLSLIGCVVFYALNPQLFDPTMQSYLSLVAEQVGMPIDQVASSAPIDPFSFGMLVGFSVVVAPLINMIPAIGEEVGWRGMLFPTLAEHLPVRAAVLVSGIIWGLWHAPVIAMGHNYGMAYDGFPVAGILVMLVACAALGCLLSWLRLRTGSVWPCALAHGAVNAVANIGVVFCTVGQTLFGPSPLGLVAGIPMFVLAIVCFVRMGSAQSRPATGC